MVGLLAVIPGGFSALGLWGLTRWWRLPGAEREFGSHFWLFVGVAGLGALLAAGLVRLALRVLRGTDFRGYDPRDPRQGGMKW